MKTTTQPADCSHTDTRADVMKSSTDCLPDEVVSYIETCRRHARPESCLISVLHNLQKHMGYLGEDEMNAVAQLLQVPAAKVSGVATFYHFFRLRKKGRFVISVCLGTACYVRGAEHVVQRLRDELGVDFGETTSDGLFTLDSTRCLGTCGLAPVVMVNEKVHPKVLPDDIPGLLKRYADAAR